MLKLLRLLLIAGGLALMALLPGTSRAFAHPMGNFSINHFASIQIGKDSARILYVVDMAEIPTFQELSNIGGDPSGKLTVAQRAAYLPAKSRDLALGLTVTARNRRLPPTVRGSDLLSPPGAGGLPTERLYAVLQAQLPFGTKAIAYRDGNFAGRSGWKEIVIDSTPATRIS